MFLFLFKSKYRRKTHTYFYMNGILYVLFVLLNGIKAKCTDDSQCGGNGLCKNETCICQEGWQGSQCQFCGGKVR